MDGDPDRGADGGSTDGGMGGDAEAERATRVSGRRGGAGDEAERATRRSGRRGGAGDEGRQRMQGPVDTAAVLATAGSTVARTTAAVSA